MGAGGPTFPEGGVRPQRTEPDGEVASISAPSPLKTIVALPDDGAYPADAGPPEAVSGEPEAAEVPKAGGSLVSLGAGSGSKAAAMYLAKYASKQSAEISASCAVLIDAQADIKEFASVAEDAEVPEAGGADTG